MRGASALGELLGLHPQAKVRVLVVWLPVLWSDLGPPTAAVRRRIQDPRVIEFWDPNHWASPRMLARAAAMRRAHGEEPEFGTDEVAWDVIGLFPTGTVWEDPFPTPTWYDGPVVDVMDPVRKFLSEGE